MDSFKDNRESKCINVNDFNSSLQCQFVLSTADCKHDGFFNYTQYFYCSIGSENEFKSIILCIFWMLVLFTGLGITADDFLCPALLVISKTLKLSQNIAGVTFLAFGNGASDIFSAVAGFRQNRPNLVIGELLGSGIFVTTIVTGCIFVTHQFQMKRRPLFRDIFFYILASYLAWLVFWNGQIFIENAISFIIIYLTYILVVIIGRIIHNNLRSKKSESEASIIEEPQTSLPSQPIAIHVRYPSSCSSTYDRPLGNSLPVTRIEEEARCKLMNPEIGILPPKAFFSQHKSLHHHLDNTIYSITRAASSYITGTSERRTSCYCDIPTFCNENASFHTVFSYPIGSEPIFAKESQEALPLFICSERNEFKDFLLHICPLEIDTLSNSSWLYISINVWKAPIYFLLIITVPVLDYQSPKDNWCRILNSLHCITSPLLVLLFTGCKVYFNFVFGKLFSVMLFLLLISIYLNTNLCNEYFRTKIFYDIDLYLVVLIIGLCLSLLILCTSKYEHPPSYHFLFGYVSFLVSTVWIYGLANEVVNLLRTVGILFSLTDLMLGLTVLAWGNSIGDLITNLSLARQGFPITGISACFGGPLLNLLMGIGIPCTLSLLKYGGSIHLEYSIVISLLYGTLLTSLSITFIVSALFGFESKKWHGILLIILYMLYLALAIKTEFRPK